MRNEDFLAGTISETGTNVVLWRNETMHLLWDKVDSDEIERSSGGGNRLEKRKRECSGEFSEKISQSQCLAANSVVREQTE